MEYSGEALSFIVPSVFVNSTYEGEVFYHYNSSVVTLWFEAGPCNPAVPVEPNQTYLVSFVASFRDGSTASASASVAAGAGEGGRFPSQLLPRLQHHRSFGCWHGYIKHLRDIDGRIEAAGTTTTQQVHGYCNRGLPVP